MAIFLDVLYITTPSSGNNFVERKGVEEPETIFRLGNQIVLSGLLGESRPR